MPKALGGYDICRVADKEEQVCSGCGMVMHGLGHYFGTAREGKSDIMWVKFVVKENDEYWVTYCEECWLKATGQIPLDEVGPQEVDSGF